MSWLTENAVAIQAVAAIATLGATLLLAWLTWKYVKLTGQLAVESAKQAELLARQNLLQAELELDLRKRRAAALKEQCRRIRITSEYLSSTSRARSTAITYLSQADVPLFTSLAAEVSVEATSDSDLVALALRTVVDQLAASRADPTWRASAQETSDWKGALRTINENIPKIEKACDAVLSKSIESSLSPA